MTRTLGRTSLKEDREITSTPKSSEREVPGLRCGLGSPLVQDLDPDWSPHGKRYHLRAAQPRAGRQVRIYHRGHSRGVKRRGEDPTWSVRNQIAFVRQTPRGPRNRSEPWIYVARPDGSGVRRAARGSQPDWSPDGQADRLPEPCRGTSPRSRAPDARLRRITLRRGPKRPAADLLRPVAVRSRSCAVTAVPRSSTSL